MVHLTMSKQSQSNKMFEDADNEYSLDAAFVAAIEERAKLLEVTVDYYMEEFM